MLEVSSVSFMGKPSKAVTKKITTTIKEVSPEVKNKAKDVAFSANILYDIRSEVIRRRWNCQNRS